MVQKWQPTLGAVALGLILALPVGGCVTRPAPRPETAGPGFRGADVSGAIDPALSAAAANSARGIGGTGTTEVIVIGNGALVAMQLNSPHPGGTEGGLLTGKAHDVDYPGSSPSGGPVNLQGPGGSVGATPASPGGQLSPGAPPGGTPNYTQAIPGATGDHATQNQTSTSPAPVPGAVGSSPLEVMTRVADQIRAQNRAIVEVRFATSPTDARRVAELAEAMGTPGASISPDDVRALWNRAQPAGTELFSPQHPAPGSYAIPPR
ncbi:MAG TPA: hypothetical protein VD969_16485 [Symbiobacteriaceae bacterium]|nr:hypothetical protein [Symbiobacteriaceae bacterium]